MPRLPNLSAVCNQAANFVEVVKGTKKAPCLSDEAVKDLEFALDCANYIKKYNFS